MRMGPWALQLSLSSHRGCSGSASGFPNGQRRSEDIYDGTNAVSRIFLRFGYRIAPHRGASTPPRVHREFASKQSFSNRAARERYPPPALFQPVYSHCPHHM